MAGSVLPLLARRRDAVCGLGLSIHQVVHVNLMEKLLVTTLSKLCNFVLDGGIWLNTQRPEWNGVLGACVDVVWDSSGAGILQ